MRIIPIIPMTQTQAKAVCGSVSRTTKMPCKSYSLPTESCVTGFKMAKIKGSICASCYADKGNYSMYANTIKPAQFARLDSVTQALENDDNRQLWISAMIAHIGKDTFFRFHDSGDLQSADHLGLIVDLCHAMPNVQFWLPTREYGMVKAFIGSGESIPDNLIVRLSAMYVDKPVIVPKSLQGIKGVTISNVHTNHNQALGTECIAPQQNGECRDCRLCWTDAPVTYKIH